MIGHGSRQALWSALALCFMLVSPPAAYSEEKKADTCQSDAMLVFDASGSMGTTDYALKVPRIARVKQSLARVLPEVAPVRRLGLIVYGEGAYDDCKSIRLHMRPTANAAEQMLGIVSSINPRGRTPLTESVRQAADVLDYTNRDAVIVLLTDGEETCGGDPCKTGALLKKAGHNLTVHVIGYREGESEYFKARCLADETGGKYYSVSTEDELIEALRKTLGCPFLTLNTLRHFADKQSLSRCEAPCLRVSR
ncbi:vWA domain-containing protein [Hyphomicrobium sp.]|uniref:vWA domain-containing protein n=1 Tax=Hyphomicrobium sp. TaxID=82 RepID=UPI003F6EF94C